MDRFVTEAKRRRADPEPGESHTSDRWHTNLPSAPADLLDETSLALTDEEASYLQDRFVHAYPDSLLAHLARSAAPIDEALPFPWDAVDETALTPDLKSTVETAQFFSETINGAALLYNLRLAESSAKRGLPQGEERRESYRKQIEDWSARINARRDTHAAINRHDFWNMVIRHRSAGDPNNSSLHRHLARRHRFGRGHHRSADAHRADHYPRTTPQEGHGPTVKPSSP